MFALLVDGMNGEADGLRSDGGGGGEGDPHVRDGGDVVRLGGGVVWVVAGSLGLALHGFRVLSGHDHHLGWFFLLIIAVVTPICFHVPLFDVCFDLVREVVVQGEFFQGSGNMIYRRWGWRG